jgi:hypothetical protein
MINNTSTDEAH